MERYRILGGPKPVPPGLEKERLEIFISYAGEDAEIARDIYEFLRKQEFSVFFAPKGVDPTAKWDDALYYALDTAHILIAVASSPQHLLKPWVRFEYTSFFNDIMNQRKASGKILPFICCFHPADLPKPLSSFQPIIFKPDRMDSGLQELMTLFQSGLPNLRTTEKSQPTS